MNIIKPMKKTILTLALLSCMQLTTAQQTSIDLSGIWRFQTDLMGFGKTPGSQLFLSKLPESILLPGTTDEGGKGLANTARHVDRLTRKFEYCGQAWYQREVVIPESWKDKEITLFLERCHWETTVYVDGKQAGIEEHLITPNRFTLTQQLTPGVHILTICVDNRLKYPMDQWNHGTSEYTQTNWNGITGRIELIAREKTYIHSLKPFPDIDHHSVQLDMELRNLTDSVSKGKLTLMLQDETGKQVSRLETDVTLEKGSNRLEHVLQIGKDMKLWNEFNPYLYRVTATLSVGDRLDTLSTRFGMRQVEQGEHHIRLNHRNIHLRGTLECCVFPLTGYPPTEVTEWKRIFRIVKEYGMNHVRFHSWCPPKAAFEAADETGIYLQAELPMWIKDVGKYPERREFFEKEMIAMLDEYGNHPSFLLMCNGNENEGDFSVLEDLIQKGQKYDNRHLYSASTARTHTASDQYYTSHVTSKGWITVYDGKPSTDWDRSKESDIDCPVIAHETGQRCMYPNFQEIKKYTGVLSPRNFEVFQERLARNGMLHQADDFFHATGAHTILQYKEVNEALLRTPNSGGFQLLGLTDFPGQGSAFVGVLDAFWESKGLVTPEKYRESCAPTVLLARIPKRTYLNNEAFTAQMEIYHYGENPLKRGQLEWYVEDEQGTTFKKGRIATPAIQCATLDSLGLIRIELNGIEEARKMTLHTTLNGTYHNEWDFWVYPSTMTQPATDYLYATQYDNRVKEALERGKNVLLIPQKVNGRKAKFTGHFWNPIMFNWDPMIVGTLIQEEHPCFNSFPTSSYADWQWWDVLNHATAMELEGMPSVTPVIQPIDTYEHNRKLGIAFEAQAGKGRLFVLSVNCTEKTENLPAMRQLLYSVRNYVASPEFHPETRLEFYQLDQLFLTSEQKGKATNSEAVQQLLNK